MMKTKKIILFILVYLGIIILGTKVYANGVGKVINDNVRIREKASADANILDLVSLNEKVEIISEEGDWYKVNYSNNKSGYIRKDMISVDSNDITSNTNTENENKEETQQNENVEEQNKIEEKLPIGFSGTLKNKIDVKIVPSINSTTILSIEENKNFKVIDKINKWAYIEAEGNSGWVLTSKLDSENENSKEVEESNKSEENTSENEEEQKEEKQEQEQENTKQEENKKTVNQTKYVSTELLNVRKSAEKTSEIIDQLSLNKQVTVVEIIDDSWAKVEYNGKSGYVSNKYLSDSKTKVTSRSETPTKTTETVSNENAESTPAPKEETSSKTSGNASSVISYAKQYLGYRYVMGGSSPSTGFDCSGFTSYVYRHFGVSLSRTSSAQASNGTAVSRSNLQAGDVLIFRDSSNSRVGHVGIYIGGNSFIHAANPSKGVIISSLSESYYAQRYVGARRVL